MLNNKRNKDIQIFYILYFVFAVIFGLTICLSNVINNFWPQISFVIISFSPLFVVLFFEIFIPFNLKIKGYSGFWRTLFTIFLYNSKNSKKLFAKAKKQNFIKQFKVFVWLLILISILNGVFLIMAIVDIRTFNFSLMILIIWFIVLNVVNIMFIFKIRKKGSEIWI